uniref:HOOK_N domain-containing protein n=1 Tax=Strongyloides papillosus TaxID=174720 RepID=A0A0N5BK70_STREA
MNEEVFWSGCLAEWIKDLLAGEEPLIPINTLKIGYNINNENSIENNFRNVELQYKDLCDGFLLNLVYFYADSDSIDFNLLNNSNLEIRDFTGRLKYLKVLLSNLCQFYENRLGRVIVMSLPDLISIARNPSTDQSGHEMNKLLFLLFGCTVQCERKEYFVARFKTMSCDLQNALLSEIKKITDDSEYTMDIGSLQLSHDEEHFYALLQNFQKIMKERDSYAKCLLELALDMESDSASSTNASIGGNALTYSSTTSSYNSVKNMNELSDRGSTRTPSPTTFERSENLKITELTDENRKLKDAIYERDDTIAGLMDNLKIKEKKLSKYEEEVKKLLKDSVAAQQWQDEAHCLKHQLSDAERKMSDYENMKKKLSDYDFYRNRVKDLEKEVTTFNDNLKLQKEKEEHLKNRVYQLSIFEKQLSEQEAINKELQMDIEKERENSKNYMMENHKLKCQVETLEHLYSESQQQLELNNTNSLLKENSLTLAEEIEYCERPKIAELIFENQNLKNQLENSFNLQNETNHKLDACSKLDNEIEMYKKELLEKEKALSEIKKTLSHEEVKKEELLREVDGLKADKITLSKTLEDTTIQLLELQTDLKTETEAVVNKEISELKNVLDEKEKIIYEINHKKSEIESLLEEVKNDKKKQKHEIDDLKQIIDKMSVDNSNVVREKRTLENERNVLKMKLENCDETINKLNLKCLEIDNLSRKLKINEQNLSEKCYALSEIESERDSLKMQIQTDNLKIKKLSTEVESERNKISDLISRLRTVITTMKINGEQFLGSEMNNTLENICSKDDSDLVTAIDSVFMESFNAARKQADALRTERQKQIDELDVLKKDIEGLRKDSNDIPCISEEKESLIKENKENKEKIVQFESKIRQLEVLENSNKINLKKIKDLENEKRNMSSNLENITSLNESLNSDIKTLRKQAQVTLSEKNEYLKKLRDFETAYENLMKDYDCLNNIYGNLVNDYNMRRSEIEHLKSQLKSDSEFYELQANMEQCLKKNRNLEEELYEERSINVQNQRQLVAQQIEDNKIRKELNDIRNQFNRLNEDYQMAIKNEALMIKKNNGLEIQIDEMKKILVKKDHEIQELRDEIKKLKNIFERERNMLNDLCNNLERKNKELLHQRNGNNKDTYYIKDQGYERQLENFGNIKEMLEEKISDQYKNLEKKSPINDKGNNVSKNDKTFKMPLPVKKLQKQLPNIHPSSSSEDCGSSTNSNEETLMPPTMSAKLTNYPDGQLNKNINRPSSTFYSRSETPMSENNTFYHYDKNNDDCLDVGNDSGVYLHSYSDTSYHSYSSSSSSTPDQFKMMSARDKSSNFKFAPNPKSLHETEDLINITKKSVAPKLSESQNCEIIPKPLNDNCQKVMPKLIDRNISYYNYGNFNSSESCTVEDITFIETKRKSFERQSLTTRSLRYLKSPIERFPSRKMPDVKSSVAANGAKGLACCFLPISRNRKAIKNDTETYKPNVKEQKCLSDKANIPANDSNEICDSTTTALIEHHFNSEYAMNGIGTCSSSEGDANSVEYESINNYIKPNGIQKSASETISSRSNLNHIRYRNGYSGNNFHIPSYDGRSSTAGSTDYEVANINKNYENVEVPVQHYPSTPPVPSKSNAPFQYRQMSLRQPSLLTNNKNKDLPPPYGKKPPSYTQYQQTHSRSGTPNLNMKHFKPKATSTPKTENDTSSFFSSSPKNIPGEGERRHLNRENDKSLSVYENVEMEEETYPYIESNNSEKISVEEKWQNYGCL